MELYRYGFFNPLVSIINSSERIAKLEKRITKLQKEKNFLEDSQLPLFFDELNANFICRDYSKATNLGIASIEKIGPEYSTLGYGPAGSSRDDIIFLFPHFYSDFNDYKVIFQHETFLKDLEKMIFLKILKDMSGDTLMNKKMEYGNTEKVRGFFAKKNAPKKLLKRFEDLSENIKTITSL